jgi:hypothetical protein
VVLLAACNPSSTRFVELAELPAELRECFDRVVVAPKAKRLTERQVVQLIADLRRSELEKAGCGKSAVAFYDAYAEAAREANVK